MYVVLDTNVLVSALWAPEGSPARILALVLNGRLTPCYDSRIMMEYKEVLGRKKFGFSKWETEALLGCIEDFGLSVVPVPLSLSFTDEEDKKFYEAAISCGAMLVTGNLRHFPAEDALVISPADFLASLDL